MTELNPEVPAKLEEIIHKALEKDRDLRYQHAADIRTDLQRLKRDTESGHLAAGSGHAMAPARGRLCLARGGKILVLALLLGRRHRRRPLLSFASNEDADRQRHHRSLRLR